MKDRMIIWAYISVLAGIFFGFVMVWLISVFRRKQAINSLVRKEDLVGMLCTVELPFDNHSKGKVRVHLKGSTVEFVAFTQEEKMLNRGEKGLVVGMEKNKLWVVSAAELEKK